MRPSVRRKLSITTSRAVAPAVRSAPVLGAGGVGGGDAGDGAGLAAAGAGRAGDGVVVTAAGGGPAPSLLLPKGSRMPSGMRVTCTRGEASVRSRRRTRVAPGPVAPGRSTSCTPAPIDRAPT